MKNRILILIFLLQVTSILAQKENPFKSAKLKLNWDEPSKVETNQNTISLPYKSIFDKNDDYLKRYSILNQKKGDESVMVQKSEFKNPGDEVKEKLNKETQQGSWENVFFGKFKVSTPVLKIRTRDHMDPDGDKVRIILNDVTVVNVINLDSDFKTSYIDLREGDNLMDIVALNQGLSGPNTATFAIYDEKDN